ncbi:MAG TPA: YggS family pyridoxal phosphate-dependent enzyme [Anaerolineae bacterium]|nr:YggS family pyridoxal phosphate-dependent enzyme [Anaerolineae bacterium]
MLTRLADNLHRVQERIRAAARRAGRDPAEVTLVAVTKTHPVDTLLAAYELGVRHFGENRVEEALEKIPAVQSAIKNQQSEVTWHMIGHIQSRKAEQVANLFDWAHSVDSLKLAERLNRFAAQQGKQLTVLLEFNVSGEASKYGMRAPGDSELLKTIEAIGALPQLRLAGLMTLAPLGAAPESARPIFRALRELRDQLAGRFPQAEWRQLSMGMTDDFEVAIEEGATLVRVGRAIFGERRQSPNPSSPTSNL